MKIKRLYLLTAVIAVCAFAGAFIGPAMAQESKKPNILVIWGDDIGWANISAYNHGMMGYKTPNIDRLANEGVMFTHYYAQQSCTAGRAAFIMGQHPFRTGLLTIGMPGSEHGIPDWAPTLADLLKEEGYATGQFGKTIWVTKTSTCPRPMASMNSSAIYITSTLKRSQRRTIIRRIPPFIRNTVPAV